MHFKWLKAKKPGDLSEFKGKTLTMMDGERVVVETIVGSKVHETRFEVNGKHHVVILSAYAQLNNDKSITQQMIDDFDEISVEHIEAPKPKPCVLDYTPLTPLKEDGNGQG